MDAEDLELLCEREKRYINVPVPPGEMSPRERFLYTMDFKPVDRVIDTEFGYWATTLERWHEEGLPDYVKNNDEADIFFGFDTWKKNVPVTFGLCPVFEEEILDDDGHSKIMLNKEHVKCEVFSHRDEHNSMPHYLDFPIKDTQSYRELFKERLQPNLEKRINVDLAEIGKQVAERNYVLANVAGSTAGKIRNWMGFEGICMAIYDQPEILDEILADLETQMCSIANAITEHIAPDLVLWWEDIAFKNGPIVTPKFFNEKCGAVIGNVMRIYQQAGCRFSFSDCDGDFRKLIPGWLDNGVNIMFPLEVGAGIHPAQLRNEFPGIRMMGGVDKSALTLGHDAIKKELLNLKPIVDEGGYIPHVDHRVPNNVSYPDYLYYLEAKRDIFGMGNHICE